jgi:GAF domain-containing protein
VFNPFIKTGSIGNDLPRLIESLHSLIDPDLTATLANSAGLLKWYLDDVNWVGFYLWVPADRELVLGPFQGLPACVRIKPGRGVCGTAWATRKTQIVDDVHLFPGHIACDSASRSELVIPLMRHDDVIGVLDIDSPIPGRFEAAEAAAMESFCQILMDRMEN